MEQKYSFTKNSVLLILGGIAVNIGLAQLVLFLDIPIFLDSLGTILVAAVGGYLPGIIVGFFSNAINGLSDTITLYYALISILIAAAAAFLSSKGWFAKIGKALAAAFIFALIGGGLGSVLTWLLYGFGFGSGVSAPFAVLLHESYGLSEFAAQLTADVAIDVADKIVTVLACFAILKLVPDKFWAKFPNRHVYRDGEEKLPRFFLRRSLRSRVVTLIALTSVILGVLSAVIGCVIYGNTVTGHYIDTASSVASMELSAIDAANVSYYLSSGKKDGAYFKTETALQNLRDSVPDVEYVYVYQVRADGCHVVFDTDAPDLAGGELGDVVPIEKAFLRYEKKLLAGEEIPPVVSNDTYGWLLTVYQPVRDSSGRCVAYAAADVAMDSIVTDRAVFIIKMVALMFGVSILIVAFAIRFAEKYLVNPINAMAKAAGEFAYDDETERLESTKKIQTLDIHTGDEIENLYEALKKTVTDVSDYIADIKEKAAVIAQMQDNIIISFADMVENRDVNTGEHIRRTAAYVRIIASELRAEGKYPEVLNDDYIDTIVSSAPLHDLGKIRISDTILNKPGKLTPEEFDRVKTHTVAGKEIIEGVIKNIQSTAYLAEAENMAVSHHERWDGAGYPYGLKGEDIPLSARIMAVADVYDALVSKRSYKEPMSPEEALEIIRSESGAHFDPMVVEAFIKAREAIDSAGK